MSSSSRAKVTHAGIRRCGRWTCADLSSTRKQALDDVERRYPAEHYVLVDDKLRILTAVKKTWGERVTTVFVRQGTYAHDPAAVGALPAADVTIERIGDLLDLPVLQMPAVSLRHTSGLEVTP